MGENMKKITLEKSYQNTKKSVGILEVIKNNREKILAGIGSITIVSGMLLSLKSSDNSQKRTYTSEIPVNSNIMHKYKFSLDECNIKEEHIHLCTWTKPIQNLDGITEYEHIYAWFNDEEIKDIKTKYEDFNFELTNEYKFVSLEPETNDNNKSLLKK